MANDSILRAVAAARADFAVLDTIGLFHDGDENSNSDWKNRVVKRCKRISNKTGCAFCALHHFSNASDRSGAHRIRGARAIRADADTVLTLEQTDPGRYPTRRLLTFEKIKNQPDRQPMLLQYDGTRNLMTVLDEALSASAVATTLDPRLVEVAALVTKEITTAVLHPLVMDKLKCADNLATELISKAVDAKLFRRMRRGVYRPPLGSV